MKKNLFGKILALLCTAGMLFAAAGCADENSNTSSRGDSPSLSGGNEQLVGCLRIKGSAVVGYDSSRIPEDGIIKIPDNITVIDNNAFYNCTKLTEIEIPNSVISIGNRAFYKCTNLRSVEIPDNVKTIGEDAFACDFYDQSNLKEVKIGRGVESIEYGAFNNCDSITDVYYNNNTAKWESLNCDFWEDVNIYCLDTPEFDKNFIVVQGTTITYHLNNNYTTFEIPEGITALGGNAFYNCSSLTDIIIPASVKTIESGAFSGCSRLMTVHYNGTLAQWCEMDKDYGLVSNPASISLSSGIELKTATELTIPSTVTRFGNYTFYGCSNLEKIEYGSTWTDWKEKIAGTWENNLATTVMIHTTDTPSPLPSYFTVQGTTITYLDKDSADNEIIIPEGITEIGASVFSGYSNLTEITIPSSVTSIGNWAFGNCINLQNITIPASVTNLGAGAFYNCNKLENIDISPNITSLENNVFYGCSNLIAITIPTSAEIIGDSAFYNCTKLESLIIPYRTSFIGFYAFYGCSSLESVIFQNASRYWYYSYEKDSSELFSIAFPSSSDFKGNANVLKNYCDIAYIRERK